MWTRDLTADRWPGYLATFHTLQPGITEQILSRARTDDGDAYDWLSAAVTGRDADRRGPVMDLACGNGPLWSRLGTPSYLGIDASAAELSAARARGVRQLIRARAPALPIAPACIATVVSSMALQVLTPLPETLAEIGRVLRPGGQLVATMPDRAPLRTGDLPIVVALLATLGRRLSYPNDAALAQLPELLADAGLLLIDDARRRYVYPMRTTGDAHLFLASLYLPDLPTARRYAAGAYLRVLARARVDLPIPIRRITAVKL